MRYLTVQEVIAIHFVIMERYSPKEQKGVKDPALLESAVYRPQQSVFGQDAYPTIFEKAAALFESLAKNHCFYNANKRTAFVSLIQFLTFFPRSLPSSKRSEGGRGIGKFLIPKNEHTCYNQTILSCKERRARHLQTLERTNEADVSTDCVSKK